MAEVTKDYPYIIGSNELNTGMGRTVGLWYFIDGIVMTDNWKVVENAEEVLGKQILEELPALFWEYEIGEVYVRNEVLDLDFTIGSCTLPYEESVSEDMPEELGKKCTIKKGMTLGEIWRL